MLNMNIMTLQERVHRRSGHIAVSYGDSLLVWGGFMEGHSDPENSSQTNMYTHEQCSYHYTDEVWMYNHDTELWKRLLTSGDIPPPTCGSCGVVHGNSLYVFGGFCHSDNLFGNTNQLYRLDMATLRWQLLTPSGQAPAACDKLAGWAHRDKVYFFGGFGPRPDHYVTSYMFVVDPSTAQSAEQRGWNNQLVAYEPHSNTWVWPKVGGEAPSPRAAHAADITGDRAYIFGGRFMLSRRYDLVCLDYSTMRWNITCLSSTVNPSQVPPGRSWHSLTFITPDRAILYGGLNNQNVILSDCWCIDVSQKSAARIWKQNLRENEPLRLSVKSKAGRFWHQAVASPRRDALYVMGGTVAPHNRIQFPRDHAEELLVLEFTPKTLFRLCMDAVLKTVPVNHWFEARCLPKDIENILVLRLEQNPSLSLL